MDTNEDHLDVLPSASCNDTSSRMVNKTGQADGTKRLIQAARKSIPPFEKKDLARISAGR